MIIFYCEHFSLESEPHNNPRLKESFIVGCSGRLFEGKNEKMGQKWIFAHQNFLSLPKHHQVNSEHKLLAFAFLFFFFSFSLAVFMISIFSLTLHFFLLDDTEIPSSHFILHHNRLWWCRQLWGKLKWSGVECWVELKKIQNSSNNRQHFRELWIVFVD